MTGARLGSATGSLSDHAAEAIRQHIIAGDYAVGTWLPGERELGEEELGVSRVAVREALKMLEAWRPQGRSSSFPSPAAPPASSPAAAWRST